MSRLSPRTELLLATTLFCNAPDAYGDRLRAAAEDYLTWPDADVSQRYTLQLAYGALHASGRPPCDRRQAALALREILALALSEIREAGDAIESEAAIAAGVKQWQERADLQ